MHDPFLDLLSIPGLLLSDFIFPPACNSSAAGIVSIFQPSILRTTTGRLFLVLQPMWRSPFDGNFIAQPSRYGFPLLYQVGLLCGSHLVLRAYSFERGGLYPVYGFRREPILRSRTTW